MLNGPFGGPSPLPSPEGRGSPVLSAERKTPALTPLTRPGSPFPLPTGLRHAVAASAAQAGKGQGEWAWVRQVHGVMAPEG